MEAHLVSQRRACSALNVDRSTVRYQSRLGDRDEAHIVGFVNPDHPGEIGEPPCWLVDLVDDDDVDAAQPNIAKKTLHGRPFH